MSERRTLSSPASHSPGRLPSISRPDWPWVARNYPQRNQQESPHPPSSTQGSSSQNSWDPRLSVTSNQSGTAPRKHHTTSKLSSLSSNNFLSMSTGETTRQWTFTGFEWVVRDVHKLRDFVESVGAINSEDGPLPTAKLEDFEVLRQSPMLGDHKFKLEIATMPVADRSSNPPALYMYITSLMLEFAQEDHEIPATMMAAIKCQDDRFGERGARPDWIGSSGKTIGLFAGKARFGIHCPSGPAIPQQPSAYYVPKDLLDGLEASLDNSNTGDVRFVCLEKYTGTGDTPALSPTQSTSSVISGSISTTYFGSNAIARKRTIYAHSDILMRRSEYFATMLSSSFSENPSTTSGERKVHTIVVEDADFETIYWLLKYCYANWLLFKRNDDPRAAVQGVGAGWSTRWLTGHQGEWEWKRFHKVGLGNSDAAADNRSAASNESLPLSSAISSETHAQIGSNISAPPHLQSAPGGKSTTAMHTTSIQVDTTHAIANTTISPRTGRTMATSASGQIKVSVPSSNALKPKSIPASTSNFPSSNQYTSTNYPRKPNTNIPTPDPHPHPIPSPAPASALSIYQVAHRYIMPNLASLALEHILSTITPQSSFALLLATSLWDELHTLIEDFVVERWEEVHVTAEFEQCLNEVSAGEWGPDGGKTLMSVFRRLRSPSS